MIRQPRVMSGSVLAFADVEAEMIDEEV